MAQEGIEKVIRITFDNSQLGKKLQETYTAIDELNFNIKSSKKEIKELEQAVKDGTMTREKADKLIREERKNIKESSEELKIYKGRLSAYSKELRDNIKIQTAAEGSLVKLRAEVSKMTTAYNNMSKAERESESGKQFIAQLYQKREAIKEAEAAIGDYRSNVGDYENAIKRALGVNNSFLSSFKALATPVGAIVGIIGGATAAVKLFRESLHSTQKTGDAYDYAMAGWSNTWDLFKKSVASVDFSIFIRNAAEAYAAGKNLKEILDELFERTNSITLQEAKLAKENKQLLIQMRDVNLSYKERIAAGNKYLANEQKMAKQREDTAKAERDAQLENLFALTKTREYASKEEREAAKQEFANKIENYNLTLEQIRAANKYREAQQKYAQEQKNFARSNPSGIVGGVYGSAQAVKDAKEEMETALSQFQKIAGEQADEYYQFIEQYNLTNDEQVKAYVDAQKKLYDAESSFFDRTQRAQTTINSLLKQNEKQTINSINKIDTAMERAGKINGAKFAKAFAEALSDPKINVQAIIDDALLKEQEREIREKFLKIRQEAYANNEDPDKAEAAVAKAMADEQLRIAREKEAELKALEDGRWADRFANIDEYLDASLSAEEAVQDAVRQTARITAQEREKARQETVQLFSTLGNAAGALSQMFEVLGGEGERYAEFSKALAVMQILINQGLAIANIWTANSKLPPPLNYIATAASLAATIPQIVSALNTTKSTATPKYAQGGLVTGPGTATSDSIPAMLSNGESVMTARATADWGAVLSAINVESGGHAIDVSNLPQRGDGMRGMRDMMEDAIANIRIEPYVTVKDINAGQRRVKVAENLGKLGGKKKSKH